MNIDQIYNINNKEYDTLLAHLAEAFISNPAMLKDLNKLNERYKYKTYKLARKSYAYTHPIMNEGSLEMEVNIKRMLGLILYGEENDKVSNEIVLIIKKYYFELYTKILKKEKIINYIIDKYDINKYLSSFSIPFEYIAFYLYIKINSGDIESQEEFLRFVSFIWAITESSFLHYHAIVNKKVVLDVKREQIDSILKRIIENKGMYNCYEDIRITDNEDLIKYNSFLELLFEYEGMNITKILNNIKFTSQDIDEIIVIYNLKYHDKNIERSFNSLINGIIIKTLLKSYRKVKKEYFKNNKETLYLELENLEDTIESYKRKNDEQQLKIEELNNIAKNYKNELNNEVKRIRNQYNKEINLLNNNILELNKELEEERKNKVEIDELRNLIFKMESNHHPTKIDVNTYDIIKNKNIIIIGGATDWRKRIKEKYPNISILDGYMETFDVKILNNTDVVFFYVGFMSHSTYYKAINYIKSNSIPFRFIGKTNLELVESEMAEELLSLKI